MTSGQESLIQLHHRVLAGDPSVRDEMAGLILPLLGHYLRRRWPYTDEAAIQDAVEDALLRYLHTPSVYDPSRSPLDRYLALAATTNLKDALRRDQRRLQHELPIGNDSPDVALDVKPSVSRWRDLRTVLRAGQTTQERAFLHARLRGERRVAVLARILRLEHLSVPAQRGEVHRTWVRLRLRVRRARAKELTRRLLR